MFENDPLQKASEYAKAALLRLEFLGLPPTPQNFSLMYAYASGKVPEIKSVMDEAVRKGGLSGDQARAIYERHMGAGSEREAVDRSVKALNEELARVMSMVQSANVGTSQFSQTLNSFSGEIAKPMSVEEIRATVSKVMQETKTIAQQNQQLQAKLEQSAQQLNVMKEDLTKAQKESLTDPLTGVGNRKHFTTEMKRLAREAEDLKTPLSLLMIDIDHFKKFNDTHGHQVGDQVLKLVARTMTENLKGRDIVCRYGGEEFVVILGQTKLADANRVADALRQFVAGKKIIRRDNNQSLGTVTISVGVAQYHEGEALSQFLRRADTGVYLAKAAGRNKVVVQDFDAATMAKMPEHKGAERFSELDSDDLPTTEAEHAHPAH
ncbi:MAG: GGDEF domain-containing protein [Proteobacteria bacterium]|nr:GGDEF domain-containing protein [Pseudomonadota bacterium]